MNMRNILSLAVFALLIGCATTTRVFPIEGGNFKIVASSDTQSAGYASALAEIKSYCSARDLDFEVIEDRIDYVGADKATKALVSSSDTLTRDIHDLSHAETIDRKDDNRVTMTFRCKSAVALGN
jgi:hypothetical protein